MPFILDIDAYNISCNNHFYRNSRICTPDKERYQRDSLRMKSENQDKCITGAGITALSQFQTNSRSLNKSFKPVPDRFTQDMAHSKKALPKGDS